MREASEDVLEFLGQDIGVDLRARATHVRVAEFCRPPAHRIDQEASLLEAIHTFLADPRALSMLITREGETVGVLRLADLFDALAGAVLGQGEVAADSGEMDVEDPAG
jgi:hypothetical protein